jgi:hypothetical protein
MASPISDMFSNIADDEALAKRAQVADGTVSQMMRMADAANDNTPTATSLGLTTSTATGRGWSYQSGSTIGGALKLDPLSSMLFNPANAANNNRRVFQVQ